MSNILSTIFGRNEKILFNYLINSGMSIDLDNVNSTKFLVSQPLHEDYFWDIKKKLIEAGANVNVTDRCGSTLLIIYAKCGVIDKLEYLISAGANLNIRDSEGDTALIKAVRQSNYDRECLKVIKLLIDAGASVNIINKSGDTALTIAALWGFLDVVKYLIENGANANLTICITGQKVPMETSSKSPLIRAACGNHPNVVKFLINYGVKIDEHPALENPGIMEIMDEYQNLYGKISNLTLGKPRKNIFSNWQTLTVLEIIGDKVDVLIPKDLLVCEIGKYLFI